MSWMILHCAVRAEPVGATGDRRTGVGCAATVFFGLAACLAAGGCGPHDRDINAFMHSWEASVSGTDFEVQPPDSIEITSANVPEIDGEVATIYPDGKISLRLVGDVKVAGMTPTLIARKLESILSKYYVNPVVSVRVAERRSKRIYVFGHVNHVGAHPYTGRDTVISVLAQARPTFIAWKRNVKVIRPSHEENKRHVVTVDTNKITEEGNLELNFLLEEGDIVYVPPTPLGWIGLKVQELLNPILPVQQAVTAPAITNSTVENNYTSRN